MTVINVRRDAAESLPGDVLGDRGTAVPGDAAGSRQRGESCRPGRG